ncbi:MAG: class I SAM-dependent methyltransferase [Pseudomonadales bacterium]|nr:class I SAM-dependent methyltransferase [Pseudomonadales bacterium]MBO6565061.1 class I SAM-dependent methyltransferase [Pseudomonadales bacterium]MBO6594314.1 class I SAM-dependent methyltransferase [Pseudomonadales bacterium]MBO6822125.1 class I SAM-dependent methyltransferase [Pseudomonadales bacterium]
MALQTIDFDRMKLSADERILDLGCGEGRHAISAYMVRNLEAVGIDLSLKDLKTTKERFEQFVEPENDKKSLVISVANGEHLPFEDESFDKIICSEVLEHIPNYRGVIEEIARVLKTGGIAAISVPRYFPEWVCWQLSDAYHEVEGGHIRIFDAGELKQDVESAGFIRYDKHHAHSLHVPYWWLKCMFWRGDDQPQAAIVDMYHRFLTWDLMQQPRITRWLDWLLNPIMGKSVVMYFVKTHCSKTDTESGDPS